MKLWQLIKSHLGPYRDVLLVVVVLQAIATFASLTLPTINALLIDNGVLTGRQRLHLDDGRRDDGLHDHPDHLHGRRRLVRVTGGDGIRS